MPFSFGFKRKPSGPPPLPEFYLRVRGYVHALLDGNLPDEVFEATSLSENGFTSLGYVLVLLSVAERYHVPDERLENFMRVGADTADALIVPTLTQRARILRQADLGEAEVYALLDTGVVGDRKEIRNLLPDFDNIEALTRMAYVVRSLEHETAFDTLG